VKRNEQLATYRENMLFVLIISLFASVNNLEQKERRKYKKQTDVIYSRKDSERKCAKPMGRKSKEQLRQERVKKLQSERAKRYYEKQQQRGKVRIVRWTTQDEKQFLDEFIFPNLPKLVEKWKAQQSVKKHRVCEQTFCHQVTKS